jgi:hypothetical protein
VFDGDVKYKCITGYYVGGKADGKTEFSTSCQADGVLSDPLVCDPVNGGAPPEVLFATPHIAPEVSYGMHLQYFCNLGYTLDGTKNGATKFPRRCLANGKFEGLSVDQPCKPISFGELPEITGAHITEYNGVNSSHFTLPITARYPDGVEYHCLSGFTLTGGSDGPTKFVASVNANGELEPALPEKCLPITFYATGQAKNAKNGVALDNVQVSIAGPSIKATSSNGYFTLKNVLPGAHTVKFALPGYISVQRKITVSDNINAGSVLDVSMSPEMREDQWRAIVKWNAEPTDTDSYAQWGYSTVSWHSRHNHGGNMQGTLEQDAANGYGPETLFLEDVGKCTGSSQACDIKYLINDKTESKTMLDKGATVTLYSADGLAGAWKIKDCRPTTVSTDKNWWHVFTIDGQTNQLKWDCT